MNETPESAATPNTKTFSSVLGEAVWLMSMDKDYKKLPIEIIEGRILPSIILQQFKLYSKGKQPVAFLTWALVEENAEDEIGLDRFTGSNLKAWSAGKNLRVIDCISPFAPAEEITQKFLADIAQVPNG